MTDADNLPDSLRDVVVEAGRLLAAVLDDSTHTGFRKSGPGPEPGPDPDLGAYESREAFCRDLAAVLTRAKQSPPDVVDDQILDAALTENRPDTPESVVTVPVHLERPQAKLLLERLDENYGGHVPLHIPVTERLCHEIDAQLPEHDSHDRGRDSR